MFCTSFGYRKEKTNEEEETSYQINRVLERPLNEYKENKHLQTIQ
jgi:mannose-1-phosphate guanylyltransferase